MNGNTFEKAFDMLLDDAAERAAVNFGKNAPEASGVIHSEKHIKKMNAIFAKERKKQRRQTRMKRLKTASAVAAVCVVCGTTMFGVEAFRVKVMNFIYDREAPNSDIFFSDEIIETYTDKNVTLGYIPEGFHAERQTGKKDNWYIIFKSEDRYFYVSADPIDGRMNIDTENAVVENIRINGMEGILSASERVRILVWHDSTAIYSITGNITQGECIEIAENMATK